MQITKTSTITSEQTTQMSRLEAGVKLIDGCSTVEASVTGAILGAEAAVLEKFLRMISDMHADRIRLQLEGLELLGLKGMRVLTRFVKIIKKQGGDVEILGLQPEIRVAMKNLGFYPFLLWVVKRSELQSTRKS